MKDIELSIGFVIVGLMILIYGTFTYCSIKVTVGAAIIAVGLFLTLQAELPDVPLRESETPVKKVKEDGPEKLTTAEFMA